MILVTDATSRVGSGVVRQLAVSGRPVRALVPTLARTSRIESPTTEFQVGAPDNARVLSRAMDGVRTVVLVTADTPEHIAAQELAIVHARAAGVQRILKLSVAGASLDACCNSARLHGRVEQLLLGSGIPSCSVRANRLMQTLEQQVPVLLSASILTGCQGDGRVADVDARDVSAVLATLAVRDGDMIVDESIPDVTRVTGTDDAMFEAFDLTGPRALSRHDIADMLSSSLGRRISYVDCPPSGLLQCEQAAGMPAWQAQDVVAFETSARSGAFADVSPATQQLLGRPGRDFAAFAHEFAVSVRYSNAPGAFDRAPAAMAS